jgi:hypothetical protein
VWGMSAHTNKLYKLQKRAIRIIMEAKYNHPTKDLFTALHIMPLPDRIKYKNMCLVFKSLKKLVPSYMTDMFKYVNQSHSRLTRASTQNKLYIPKAKLNIYKSSFAIQGASEWNTLDTATSQAETLGSFKHCYLKHYWSTR